MMDTVWNFLGLSAVVDNDNDGGEGFMPSPFSRMLAVPKTTDYKPIEFDKKYAGDKKILVVCTELRYMECENGKKFSTGNHPVEAGVPIMHLKNAGFEFDVATPTGKPACMEKWALATKDETFMKFYNEDFFPKTEKPVSLAEVVQNKLGDYVAIYLPGGHGAMLGLPEDPSLDKALMHFVKKEQPVVAICHGPAALLAATSNPWEGYRIAAFPDSIDHQTPMIGYLPGKMPWYFGEKLKEKGGMKIVNSSADATVEVDRLLFTGASPKSCQELGKVTAEKLLEMYA